MRIVLKLTGPLAMAALFSAGGFAQQPPPSPDTVAPQPPDGPDGGPGFPGFHHMELLGFGGMHGGKVVTGAPFTGTAITESMHTLADGTKITNKTQVTLYRDSQGRFRKEVSMPPLGDLAEAQPHSFVVIQDPVAGKGYVLNPDKKVAHVMNNPERGKKGERGGAPGGDLLEEPANPNVTKESLGTQTINGVSAQGTRLTRTIPAGKIGNDKPITITREVWYSPDLQMVVQSKHSDPRFGETTYSLTNVQRNEPAANLFTVPSDYSVKQGNEHRGMMRRGKMPPASSEAPPSSNF